MNYRIDLSEILGFRNGLNHFQRYIYRLNKIYTSFQMKCRLIAIALVVTIISCQSDSSSFEIISTPCSVGGEPNFHVRSDGTLLLSWIEYLDSMVSLQFSELNDGQWTEPKTIAKGDNWFVNWADFPSLVSSTQNPMYLTAHWLQKSDVGTFDYDVRISQSLDNGNTWSESFVIHDDGIAAEHGFVSMMPLENGRFFGTWLDGRNTKGEEETTDDHGHYGSMTLRAAEFDMSGKKYYDEQIDNKVCDCCQTSVANTLSGPVVVYRDRSEEEIRDIYISRRENGKWSLPQAVFHDNWKIEGCPVNGPVVVAKDRLVAVTWFSMADDSPEVKVAFSIDEGENFDLPFRIDKGNPIGRVDMKFIDNDQVIVSWLEQTEKGADIIVSKVDREEGAFWTENLVQSDHSRRSGFPQMAILDNNLYMTWTAVDTSTFVKSGVLKGFK